MVSKRKRHVSCDACFAMQNGPNEFESSRHYATNADIGYVLGKVFEKLRSALSLRSSNAPVTMERPGTLLTLFAAVLCPAAPAALSKLPRKFFPFTTLVISALPNPAPCIILTAEVPHDDASPVLHICTVVSHSELLHQREDVEIIR